MSISQFLIEIDRYMLDCSAKGLSPKTLKLFRRYLLDNFEIDDVKSVKIEHIRAYIRSIEERGKFEISAAETPVNYPERCSDFGKPVSKTTIIELCTYHKSILIALIFRTAYTEQSFERFKECETGAKIKVMLEDNELKQFFRSFDVRKFHQYRDWIIARLIFDTVARIGELLEVVVSDIDLRGNALLLRKTAL